MSAAAPASPLGGDDAARRTLRAGLIQGIFAYGFWGVVPIYFRTLSTASPVEVLFHRVLGSLVLLLLLMRLTARWSAALDALRRKRTLAVLVLSSLLIAANWTGYIYAVSSGQTLQGSLGYYINPLFNVVLGVLILGERLRRAQIVSVLLAGVGVVYLTLTLQQAPWLALGLAASFSLYGLVRKLTPVDALTGLTVETLMLSPIAAGGVAYGLITGWGAFLHASRWLDAMLLLAGPVTALPLLAFVGAARRLPLTLLGILQYLSPTGQFLVAVLLFGEPFTLPHAICFGCIWAALALFAWDMQRSAARTTSPTRQSPGETLISE
ncbi:MAG: EamA family transporter RarD [Planctomycetes bacterium]|nr:EamA family transporter RarD [Planctomycetota bacterium]